MNVRTKHFLASGLAYIVPLVGFTIVAVLGYLVFVVTPWGPQNLARVAHYEWIPKFYGASFIFFAQAHILIGTLVLFAYLIRVDRLRWLGAFVAVYAVSLSSELIGTSTGLPFGAYAYSGMLGAKWFELVPVLIPVSWFLMAVPGFLIAANRFRRRLYRIVFGAVLLTAWDLALDPAMSYLTTYWIWGESGVYYGMPLLNLAGWFVTSLVLMYVLELFGIDRLVSRQTTTWMRSYYVVTILLPLGMIAAEGLWTATLVTAVAVAVLIWISAAKEVSPRFTGVVSPLPDSAHAAALADIPVDLQQYFEDNSRSFSFAARFFSKPDRVKISRLYAFCRVTDDLVDEYTDDRDSEALSDGHLIQTDAAARDREQHLRKSLDSWRTIARSSFQGQRSGVAWLDELMADTRESGADFDLIEQLFAGVESDIDQVRIVSDQELDQYAFKVGSVVGIWMCFLLGVRSEQMHGYAADLGAAMQITNILRDVGEDLDADRVYLPQSLLADFGITEDELKRLKEDGVPSDEYVAMIRGMMARANQLYERAWVGLALLPNGFGTAAAVASGVYRGILDEIVLNDFDNLTRRARTSPLRKLILAGKSWRRLQRARASQYELIGSGSIRATKSLKEIRQLSDEL